MKFFVSRFYPSGYLLEQRGHGLVIKFKITDLQMTQIEVEAFELITDFINFGKSIYTSIQDKIFYEDKTDVHSLVSAFNMKIVIDNLPYYKNELDSFLYKYGLPECGNGFEDPLIDTLDDIFNNNGEDFIEEELINHLIVMSLNIFLLNLYIGSSLPRKTLNTNKKEKIIDIIPIYMNILDNIFVDNDHSNHSPYNNSAGYEIKRVNFDYNTKMFVPSVIVTNIVKKVWSLFVDQVLYNVKSLNYCQHCGNIMKNEPEYSYRKICNNCIKDFRSKFISQLNNKVINLNKRYKNKELTKEQFEVQLKVLNTKIKEASENDSHDYLEKELRKRISNLKNKEKKKNQQ